MKLLGGAVEMAVSVSHGTDTTRPVRTAAPIARMRLFEIRIERLTSR